MKLYSIRKWNEIYENNRTRDLKNMTWFACPIKLNGDGYTQLMIDYEKDNEGAALFGVWIALIQVATTCNPRGVLMRSAGIPHDPATLSRICRMKVRLIEKALNIFSSDSFKWLECNELEITPQEGAGIPQEGATIPHDPALHNSTEHNITEQYNTAQETTLLDRTLKDFEEMRRKIKKPLTDKGRELLLKKLSIMAIDDNSRIEILNQSIMNCWQGVFPLPKNKNTEYTPNEAYRQAARIFGEDAAREALLNDK